MWQLKNNAFSFCPEISLCPGFILSPYATAPAATDSGLHKFLI
jgi:hypothetical protein